MYILTRYKTFKIIRKTQLTLVALLRFCFKIIASKSKMLRLEVVLPVKEPLVATFSKIHAEKMLIFWGFFTSKKKLATICIRTCAVTSKNMHLRKAWKFLNFLKNKDYFVRTPPFLLYNNSIKVANFWGFLSSKRTICGYFWQKPALTSRKYVAVQGKNVSNST